jgi:hypothetical protein
MTTINQQQWNKLTTLDQSLMWAIVSINAANLNPKNPFISDKAAIREESKDYIQWSVTQTEKGEGRFVFSALLPLINNNPLANKNSIIELILSYSPFDQSLEISSGVQGYGWAKPQIPNWIETTEQLLAYLSILATQISKYARLTRGDYNFWLPIKTKYWGECQYAIGDSAYGGEMQISGYLTIDWSKYLAGRSLIECLIPFAEDASNLSCNFPDLIELWNVQEVDLQAPAESVFPLIPSTGYILAGEESAEAVIDSYGGDYFIDRAVPDWYSDALNGYKDRSDNASNRSVDIGSASPKIIESLTICKEQDPEMSSFAISLADKVKP